MHLNWILSAVLWRFVTWAPIRIYTIKILTDENNQLIYKQSIYKEMYNDDNFEFA